MYAQSLNSSHCWGEFCMENQPTARWSKSGHQGGGDQLEISGCIFDMRVFNPFTSRNCSQNVTTTYQCHEGQKRRSYKQCICTGKHGSFAPPCQQAECERKLRWHKNSLNASSETGSVTQPTNEHHQMLDQLLFSEITDQMHQGIKFISRSCHQDLSQCDRQCGAYPLHLRFYNDMLPRIDYRTCFVRC